MERHFLPFSDIEVISGGPQALKEDKGTHPKHDWCNEKYNQEKEVSRKREVQDKWQQDQATTLAHGPALVLAAADPWT